MGATERTASYDIVIAGGGMIGTSLALALEPLELKVAVVEAVARADTQQPSFDDRSTALSRSTQRMFEAMGLWAEVAAASTPIQHIHVSDKGRFGFSHIDATEQNVEALGFVVINRVLGEVLHRALQATPAEFVCPGSIVAVNNSDSGVEVSIDTGGRETKLDARLLVVADGAASSVRDMVGIGAAKIDYEQFAVIGNLLPEIAHGNRAFERFTEDGPIAILPAAEGRVAFVWIQSPAAADRSMSMSDGEFTAQLQEAFGLRLGHFSRVGKRAAYPLALTKANSLISRRAAVVGNAAHGLHPVAAQGFNLGMRDVATLCDCIADAIAQSSSPDCGDNSVLENYAAWRRTDQQKVVHFTDGLVRLFADQRGPVRMMRNVGMIGFDFIPGVRRLFAKHTMGLAGHLPKLSRGVPLK